jgi:acetoin utilization protein AcuB
VIKGPIRSFMTPMPYTIGRTAPLAVASDVMNQHQIRHLPVLYGNQLVGIVSQRDIQLLETLRDVDPLLVTVEEAMSCDVLVVSPDDELSVVARDMATRKCGSALISDGLALLGIFTTIDALRALGGGAQGAQPARRRPRARRANAGA